MNRNHPNYNINKITQNTEKSSGDLRRLAITQTPVKDYHLILVWKKSKGEMHKLKDKHPTRIETENTQKQYRTLH